MTTGGNPHKPDASTDPSSDRPAVLDYETRRPTETLGFGQTIAQTARQLLVVQVLLLILSSVVLDGGVLMRCAGVTTGGCWIVLAVAAHLKGIRPQWTVRVMFWIGILLAALAVFVMYY